MLNELASHFTTKYARSYDLNVKPHPNVYTLKLLTSFVAHPTFHILKLKLFFKDEMKLD
jgi:thymidylate synthase